MQAIVFIGSNKSGSSREAIRAAVSLGYLTILLTNRINLITKRTEFPDVHIMNFCDIDNLESIRIMLRKLSRRGIEISSIVSFIDPYCYTASVLGDEYSINKMSTKAIGLINDKIASRNVLLGSKYIPWYESVQSNSTLTKEYLDERIPFIIKSPFSSGSKDVHLVKSYDEYIYYKDKIIENHPGEPLIIEEYLDGPQFLVETIVYNNKVNIIAIIEQEITLINNLFIVTGYDLLTRPDKKFKRKLTKAIEQILKSHGFENGPCHLELRYINEDWKLIEINPRISGSGMNTMIEIGFGINLVRETLKMNLGEKPNLTPKYNLCTYSHYVVISETGPLARVTGKNRAKRSKRVEAVYVKPRKWTGLHPPLSLGDRYAYVTATGRSRKTAKKNAIKAAAKIKFVISYPV